MKLTKGQGRNEECGSGIKGVGSGITAPGSGITSHRIGISSFFRDQGSGCTIFVGSGTKICHAFGIKDQKFGFDFQSGKTSRLVIAHLHGGTLSASKLHRVSIAGYSIIVLRDCHGTQQFVG